MALDLATLVPALRRQIAPPESELFEDVTDTTLIGYLSDAVWEGKLDGFYSGYTEDEGVVTPESGTEDLSRDWQQLIVWYAAMSIITSQLRTTNTLFRSRAGPVEFETQNSAQLLREHLRSLLDRRDHLLEMLSTRYNISPGYVDMVCARTSAIEGGSYGFESGMQFHPQGR